MTSVGILTLKIGLVATVTGATIATPILLNRNSGVSSVTSQNSATEGAERQGDVDARNTSDQLVQKREDSAVDSGSSSENTESYGSGGDSSLPRSSNAEEQHIASQVAESGTQDSQVVVASPESISSHIEGSSDVSHSDSARESDGKGMQAEDGVQRVGASNNSLNQVTSSLVNEVPSAERVADFDKKCFVIPAKSTGSDSVELLTCYKDQRISQETEEDWEEYDSFFHLYDRRETNNPVEIDGSLDWNPKEKQLTALLTKKVDSSHKNSFTTKESYWNRISSDSRNLLEGEECAIYKVTLKNSGNYGTYWLSCGDDNSGDFNSQVPTSIPLTDWTKRNN